MLHALCLQRLRTHLLSQQTSARSSRLRSPREEILGVLPPPPLSGGDQVCSDSAPRCQHRACTQRSPAVARIRGSLFLPACWHGWGPCGAEAGGELGGRGPAALMLHVGVLGLPEIPTGVVAVPLGAGHPRQGLHQESGPFSEPASSRLFLRTLSAGHACSPPGEVPSAAELGSSDVAATCTARGRPGHVLLCPASPRHPPVLWLSLALQSPGLGRALRPLLCVAPCVPFSAPITVIARGRRRCIWSPRSPGLHTARG